MIPLPGRLKTIEIDAHLGVWIGGRDRGGQGILWNIDPTTGRIVHSVALSDRPGSLAVAASGSPPAVWVISPAAGTIHQVDATSGEIIGSSYFGYTSDIATDSTLAWLAYGQGDSVAPVPSLALHSPFFHEGTSLVFPGSDVIAVTEEMLWGLDADGERVFPVDLATDRVGTPISVGSHPTSVALDGGFIWVANERSVSRIDGTTHSLSTIAFPGRLSFIAVTRGPGTTVWVLAQGTA